MIEPEVRVAFKLTFERGRRGRKRAVGNALPPPKPCEPGSVPRVTRLMALAIRFEQLIREGEVADYADIARLGHVTRARVTQIMNLLHLAPDIQDAILHFPHTVRGRDIVTEHDLRAIAAVIDWKKQRTAWNCMTG